jgi:hypothetical protein
MVKLALRSFLVAAAAALTPFADAAPLAAFSLRLSTSRFDYYAREGARLKPSEAQDAERFLSDVEGRLGQRITGRVSYYRVDHAADVAAFSGRYTEGLTDFADGRILAVRTFNAHEIVHRVAWELGDPGAFFQEGLAVALTASDPAERRRLEARAASALRGRPAEDFVDGFDRLAPADAYAVAGAFMLRLLEQHGTSKVAEFFRACGRHSARRDFAFRRVFGQDAHQAVAEWHGLRTAAR